jgi:hypothetical protein
MTEKRAKPGDLCKGDAFQRHYQYRTTWPLSELLHDKFFLPLRDYLFSGDTITLCRFDGMSVNMTDINVLEVVTVIVINSGRGKDRVPLAVLGDVMMVGDQQPPAAPYRVEAIKSGKAKLMKGDVLIQEYGSKSEADAAMKQLTLSEA